MSNLQKIKQKLIDTHGVVILFAAFMSCLIIPIMAILYDFYNMEIMQNDLKNIQEVAALSCVAGAKNHITGAYCKKMIEETVHSNISIDDYRNMGAYAPKAANEAPQKISGGPPDLKEHHPSKLFEWRKTYVIEDNTFTVANPNEKNSANQVTVRLCGYYEPFFYKFLERTELQLTPRKVCARSPSVISAIYVANSN